MPAQNYLDMGSFSDYVEKYGEHKIYNYRIRERDNTKLISFYAIKNRGSDPDHEAKIASAGKYMNYPSSLRVVLRKPPPPRTCWERILEDD